MDIATEPVVIPPDDQTHLGVHLVAHHAIDHMDAGFLEAPGPGDVVGLVESRLQLHHHGDLLAVLHRVHQSTHDAAIAAGAVKGLLDRQHARISGGLLEEVQHTVETLVRVVQQKIPFPETLKDIHPFAQGFHDGGHKRRIPQFR